jgi:uncharacterized membrane protein YGL010W
MPLFVGHSRGCQQSTVNVSPSKASLMHVLCAHPERGFMQPSAFVKRIVFAFVEKFDFTFLQIALVVQIVSWGAQFVGHGVFEVSHRSL